MYNNLYYYTLFFLFYQVFEGFFLEFVIKRAKTQILFSMKIVRTILKLLFLLFLAFCLFFMGYYFAVTKNEALQPQKLVLDEKTVQVYDYLGVGAQNASAPSIKQTVSYSEIPEHTKRAFIDTEDKRFFSHSGFDYKRIAKAALNNLKARSFKEGASTISQQLIKNTHLSQEKTFKRKFKEWKLTRRLEKKYSKEEILEKYLNTIYFGHSCFGLRAASEFYFGKEPDELTTGESAILAGLVKAPNYYSPFKNPEKCLQRKKSVLALMQKNGHLTEEERQIALREELPDAPFNSEKNAGFMNFVFDELSALSEQHGFTVGGKIEIYTQLDPLLQAEAEKIANQQNDCDKAIFALDVETLGFKACVSTVGNVKRLPGSLIKPLLSYAPALEENLLSPATLILDEKVNYNGYSPENYNGVFHGYVSARKALEQSLNIPAVKIFESLGIGKGVSYLQKLGLPVPKEDESLALALGGMSEGFTLKDILSAYSAFANGGNVGDCGFISAIKIDGKTVYERKENKRRVFSEETAYLTTDMLKGVAKTGTAKKLRSLPFPVAAKTGTVGTEKGNTDAYALSYTPKDCVAVWLGNADNKKIEHTGGGVPCNFLLHIHEFLYNQYKKQDVSLSDFQRPEGVVCVALDKPSYYDTHTLSLADELSPAEYRFNELFKKECVPTKKSNYFSNPSIFSPVLHFEDGKVTIAFDKRSPAFYEYKIEKYDYVTHSTVYFGKLPDVFVDTDIADNKTYIYTVIPVYNGKEGKRIILPAVTTKQGEEVDSGGDEKILNKEWWNY